MTKKNQQEELQSRREFFKKTAKSVLPIVGGIILAGAPAIVKASETQMGCDDNCWGACQRNCHGGCEGGCKGCGGNCSGECDGSCKGYCDTTCKNCLR
ncbi:MAG: Cys-Xaa-Xaa-Xaa repeat radical SAM target protein [Bacteroidales bacterium]|nr:Cys-Xaa-Xaa-Xaa repeat radical SAM target protein [Bacteroidales bacterium]MCM1147973.1 Cys-Xaa-Xaa-Xaa repeat radical SAM target protein [Bacteroidales bacterium]MCM1206897.1 Cys-Xaa-Xaa-Xaa repeat radical SAM target protein [Bacillota bacterium]MCM1509530.1 hypothetical protein [Clostridium sp.]